MRTDLADYDRAKPGGIGKRTRGAVIVACGERAREEAERCRESLRASNPGLAVNGLCRSSTGERIERIGNWEDFGVGLSDVQKSRWAKVNLFEGSPFEETVYLDADTRVQADLSAGFEMLEDGWEMVMCPSQHQGEECLWHVEEQERKETFEEVGRLPLQLQAGMMFFRKCERVQGFFEAWQEEWLRYRGQDQAAMLRALERAPVKTWLLGRPWNGGAVVQHHFGRLR